MKFQYTLAIPRTLSLCLTWSISEPVLIFPRFAAAKKKLKGGDSKEIMDIIECKLRHLDTDLCAQCTGLRQCRRCPTEYEVILYSAGSAGYALETTTWKKLGSARTPNDPKWRSQVRDVTINRNNRNTSPDSSFIPGSIRSAYESRENIAVQEKDEICH